MADIVQVATITCPACGTATEARMPVDACQYFWECPACEALVRPKQGDCCVFCSYSDATCPPVQQSDDNQASCCP